jgi:hypothetical protein
MHIDDLNAFLSINIGTKPFFFVKRLPFVVYLKLCLSRFQANRDPSENACVLVVNENPAAAQSSSREGTEVVRAGIIHDLH